MIKLFLSDVDGVLTDGVYYIQNHGAIGKSFYSRDFYGMRLLNEIGIKVGIITCSDDSVINHQCKRSAKYASLNIYTGVKNKLQTVTDIFLPHYSWDEIAYIGDDVLDLELLKNVGWAACPQDAHLTVLNFVRNHDGFVSQFKGGHGATREFADAITDVMSTEFIKEIRKKKYGSR